MAEHPPRSRDAFTRDAQARPEPRTPASSPSAAANPGPVRKPGRTSEIRRDGVRPGTPSLLRRRATRSAASSARRPVQRAVADRGDQRRANQAGEPAWWRSRVRRPAAADPNAALYSVVPSSAYVAGLYVESNLVSAAVADVTGRRVAEVSGNPNGVDDPVELVRAVERACASAGIEAGRLSALVIGSPGVVDPRTGDPKLAVNLPAGTRARLTRSKAPGTSRS